MSSQEQVRCPRCGQMVMASAMEAHQRVFCTGRTSAPTMRAVLPVAASEVDDLLAQAGVGADDPLPVPVEERFWVSPRHSSTLERVAALSELGEVSNVMLLGPAGCGKTTLPRQFAATQKRPFYEVHCGSLVDVEQWFGKDRLVDGETRYRKSRLVKALETPRCVILLDEINRAHPELLNGIFGLLDWRRSIYSDDLGYMIRVAEGVTFFATMNEGTDYFGVNPLDSALRDRFPRILRLSYPPRAQEEALLVAQGVDPEIAGRLASFASQLRQATHPVHVSPRQVLTAAEEVRMGASLREAAEVTIINRLDDSQDEKQVLETLQLIDPNPYADNAAEGEE